MQVTLEKISDKISDYKICMICSNINFYENEKCWNCGSDKFFEDEVSVNKFIENEMEYWEDEGYAFSEYMGFFYTV